MSKLQGAQLQPAELKEIGIAKMADRKQFVQVTLGYS